MPRSSKNVGSFAAESQVFTVFLRGGYAAKVKKERLFSQLKESLQEATNFTTGTVTLSWFAEYIPTFVSIFPKHISFFQLGSIFKQRRQLVPQADEWLKNPLFSLSLSNHFGWQKIIGFEMNLCTLKCHSTGWQAAKKPPVINFNPTQKVPWKLKREVFDYNWNNRRNFHSFNICILSKNLYVIKGRAKFSVLL